MNLEQLRQAHRATPFVPFSLSVVGGPTHRVPHPDFLSIAPTGRTVVVYNERGIASILDLMLIGQITMEERPPVGTVAEDDDN